MLKRIHVNQHIIRKNLREGRSDPPITVKTYRGNTRAHEVEIAGPSVLVYRPEKPLACGARLWLETNASVRLLDSGETTTIE